MLRVQDKIGFGAQAEAGVTDFYEIAITSNLYLTTSYNVFDEAMARGYPVDQVVSGGIIRLSLSPNVRIMNNQGLTTEPVITRGTGWGSGWLVQIYVASGIAYLVGRGGEGGDGAESTGILTTGCGAGGGGGACRGVKGDGGGTNPVTDGEWGGWLNGGPGGTGNLVDPGTTRPATGGGDGGPCIEAPNVGEDIDLIPAAGATLCVWPGGGGGAGSGIIDLLGKLYPMPGGYGGDATKAGQSSVFGPGGSPGAHYIGDGTVNEVGPGTIDKDGP